MEEFYLYDLQEWLLWFYELMSIPQVYRTRWQIQIQGETDLGGGNYPTLNIILHRTQVIDWNREDAAGAGELVNEPITFKAFYNESDSKQSEIELTNVTSEYDSPISA